MGMLGNIKKNKVTADFSNFVYTISGKPKAGKTSLVYKTAVEKFGNADSLLLVAFEKGYGALNDVSAIDIEKYDEFVELVDELVKNKKDLPYKMIALDTVDIMQDLAIPYVLKKAGRRDSKVYKSLTDIAWGQGWNLLSEVISEPVKKLHRAGFSIWFITHDKDKSFETKEGLKYDKTVLSLTGKVRDICLNMSDFICYIDLTQEQIDGKIVDKRKIHFRGDSTLEAGSRLEHIPDSIEYDIKGFIDAIEGAVLKEYGGDTKAVEKAKVEQQKAIDEKAEKLIKEIDEPQEPELEISKVEVVEKLKASMGKIDMKKLQSLMEKHKVSSFANPEALTVEFCMAVLKLIEVEE